MMKTFLFACSALMPLLVWAQTNPDFAWGNDMRAPSGSAIEEIVGVSPEGFYALRIQDSFREKPYLEWYNTAMELEKYVEINLKQPQGNHYRQLERVLYTGVGLFVFSSGNDLRSNITTFYLEHYDRKGLQPLGDPQPLLELPGPAGNATLAFHVHLSVDSSKVLIVAEICEASDMNKVWHLRVFDAALERQLWARSLTLNTPAELADTEAIQVDDLGSVYLIARRFYDKKVDRRKGRPNYAFEVFTLQNLGQDSSLQTVQIKDCFVNALSLKIGPDGHPVCVGLYSRFATRSSVRGVLRVNLRAAPGRDAVQLVPLDSAFLSRFMPPRKARKGRELFEFDLHESIVRLDGGVVMLAEQVYVQVSQHSPAPSEVAAPQMHYFYNDIIAVSLAPDGSLEWAAHIPKRQETANDDGYYSSFAVAAADDKLLLLYNDHARNLLTDNPKRLRTFNGRRSVVMLTTIDASGNVVRKPLFSNQENRVLTRPKIVRQMTSKVVMLYGESGRRYKFGRLEIR